jgi:excisionase family DNA binding protein
MELVRIGEVSKYLNLHINTVRRMADEGVIPSHRTKGGHRLFDLAKVKNASAARTKTKSKAINAVQNDAFDLANLEEDIVWKVILKDLDLDLTGPVEDITSYAFTEMLNNAIDHSKGSIVSVSFWANEKVWAFEIQDDGVGAFSNVMKTFHLANEIEAVAELSKGRNILHVKSS